MLAPGGRLVMRNVVAQGENRLVYDGRTALLGRLLGKGRWYQVIRRSPEAELALFSRFKLLKRQMVAGTGSMAYLLEAASDE